MEHEFRFERDQERKVLFVKSPRIAAIHQDIYGVVDHCVTAARAQLGEPDSSGVAFSGREGFTHHFQVQEAFGNRRDVWRTTDNVFPYHTVKKPSAALGRAMGYLEMLTDEMNDVARVAASEHAAMMGRSLLRADGYVFTGWRYHPPANTTLEYRIPSHKDRYYGDLHLAATHPGFQCMSARGQLEDFNLDPDQAAFIPGVLSGMPLEHAVAMPAPEHQNAVRFGASLIPTILVG